MAVIDLAAEVTGSVWRVAVQVGQRVAPDDAVLVIESMKMEIPLCAIEGGTVLEILFAEGDLVQEGDVVVRLKTGGSWRAEV